MTFGQDSFRGFRNRFSPASHWFRRRAPGAIRVARELLVRSGSFSHRQSGGGLAAAVEVGKILAELDPERLAADAGATCALVSCARVSLWMFAQQYAEAKEVALTAVFDAVMGTGPASGIPEAIAAAILVTALGKVLVVVFRKMNLGAVNVESAK